jgi:K+/H+ antiporter YhaU regulatory subunit KhtT
MEDVRVQVERLPVIGWRYTMPADLGRKVVVVAQDSGPTHLVLVDARREEPLTTIRLQADQAAVLAALLIRARFTLEEAQYPPQAAPGPEEVVVETVRIGSGSPVLGLAPDDVVGRLGSDAALLGVISDATPELVEADRDRGVQVGDKLVVAARRGRLDQLRNAV